MSDYDIAIRGNRITVDVNTHSEVLDLLQSTLNFGSRALAQPVGMNRHCEGFIRSNSPAMELPQPLSPPIFSTNSRYGTGTAARNARGDSVVNMKDLLCSLIEPKAELDHCVEDDDFSYESRYIQDMYIVDGWRE
jgi:hypothetical protein